jgi:hypothetical protein
LLTDLLGLGIAVGLILINRTFGPDSKTPLVQGRAD